MRVLTDARIENATCLKIRVMPQGNENRKALIEFADGTQTWCPESWILPDALSFVCPEHGDAAFYSLEDNEAWCEDREEALDITSPAVLRAMRAAMYRGTAPPHLREAIDALAARRKMADAVDGIARAFAAAAEVWDNDILSQPRSDSGVSLAPMSLDELGFEWGACADRLREPPQQRWYVRWDSESVAQRGGMTHRIERKTFDTEEEARKFFSHLCQQGTPLTFAQCKPIIEGSQS